jgi:4-aminobutyrate aminotransferase/(S)-3-amino-2-methylpropionate transaminase
MEVPKIIVEPPGPKSRSILEKRERYVPPGVFKLLPIVVNRAKGAVVEDVDGNLYIDFTTGIAVTNTGHTPTSVVKAVRDQVRRVIHTCIHILTYESYIELAKKLSQLAPGEFEKMAYFLNSGAEAVENAVKVSYYYTNRNALITFENSFHGRTMLTMALTSKIKPYKKGFKPYIPGIFRFPYAYCYRCVFNADYPDCGLACLDYIHRAFITHVDPSDVAAIIVEPVQGEGGYIVPPRDYIVGLRDIAEKNGMVFIDDEVQSGMGRTGYFFAIEHFGVSPDLITMAKSLGSGLPIAAVIGKREILEKVHEGGIGGTFGGNPLSCRAGLESIELVAKNLGIAKRIGRLMEKRLNELYDKYEVIGDVRGLGPMMAIELVKDRETREPAKELTNKIINIAMKKGLLLISAGIYGNVIRLIPPINIPRKLLNKGLDILDEAIHIAIS